MLPIVFLLALAGISQPANAARPLHVETTIGNVYGMINGSAPDVAQFLGIPFAEPPVGELRFRPPQRKRRGLHIDATRIGPSCPQYKLTKQNEPSVYTYDAPWLQPYGPTSEDCLTLNVWTPRSAKSDDKLPVLFWVFGGGFYEGGLLTKAFEPSNWIQKSQSHIVVAINHRVNIFGFPNARGLAETGENLNFGLLDQRLAMEWVRDNIAAFGGDPSRITMWGQSSGAASTDFYNFAWADDPIIAGQIMHSGNVFATGTNVDLTHSNFTFVAEQFGCGQLSAQEEVNCMRNVSADAIIELYNSYNMNHSSGQLKWTTIIDNVTKFGDYTERYHARNYSRVPAIVGSNSEEQTSLISWPGPDGPNMTMIYEETVAGKLCPNTHNAELRYNTSSLTFYYYNTANFSNISPRPWEGAYHTSELPLVFGTYSQYGGPTTREEVDVATRWQELYLAFIRDPIHGLPSMGWPAYRPDGFAMVFAANNTPSQLIPVTELSNRCVGVPETYN
ncbi:Alpha/Beta hydrolase protein [Aspergillus ambiguus]|uniref:Alpha/Beta hydrolase protein n=1 Tax=Aspergillus ambiguus TaxID=176160 RepID=UPI003CCCAEC9